MLEFMIDSDVILDVLTRDSQWLEWSSIAIEKCANRSRLVINPIIHSELLVRFSCAEQLDKAIPTNMFKRALLPFDASILCSAQFNTYREINEIKRGYPLPQFFIGAHALVSGYTLVTRSPDIYKSYFPELRLITPSSSQPSG